MIAAADKLSRFGAALDRAECEFLSRYPNSPALALMSQSVSDAYDAYRAALRQRDGTEGIHQLFDPLPQGRTLRELADAEAALRLAARPERERRQAITEWNQYRDRIVRRFPSRRPRVRSI